jgi:hypothetical protein
MQLVKNKQDLIDNIITFETYLSKGSPEEVEFARNHIHLGKWLCVYKVNGENHFAPGDFVAYVKNTMKTALANANKETKDTRPAIDKIAGNSFENKTIEIKYKEFLDSLDIKINDGPRKYWRLRDVRGKYLDLDM